MQFVLRTRPDKRFVRQGNDLLYNATITLVDALLGFSVKVISSVQVSSLHLALLLLQRSQRASCQWSRCLCHWVLIAWSNHPYAIVVICRVLSQQLCVCVGQAP